MAYSKEKMKNPIKADEHKELKDMGETVEIEVCRIQTFRNHPFRVVDDGQMDELVESIRVYGVMTPVLVRPVADGSYEMVSGHRRLHASQRAGLLKIPAVIKEMGNDEAAIAVVDANIQREGLLPSEKAFSLKMKMDALNHQGSRNDLTLSPKETKLQSADVAGLAMRIGHAQVHRYVRLTYLKSELLEMVDEGILPIALGVEISFLNEKVQAGIHEYLTKIGAIKLEQIQELRNCQKLDELDKKQVMERLQKSGQSCVYVRKKVTLSERKLKRFFPEHYTTAQMERIILNLLDEWKQKKKRL